MGHTPIGNAPLHGQNAQAPAAETVRADRVTDQSKITFEYGLIILHPAVCIKILPPPPLTRLDLLIGFWDEIFYPSFLFACAFTAFRVAFGFL